MEIWHRMWIDGKDAETWRRRGLKIKPVRSAFYPDGVAKTWVADISENSSLWAEAKAYMGDKPHFLNTFFTDEERLAAEWCILRGRGVLKPTEPVGGYWSHDYYEDRCSPCGTGWRQIAPFHVAKQPQLGRNAFASFGSAYELFAINEVFTALEIEGIKGLDSWPLLVGKNKHPADGVRQLLVKSVAEPAIMNDLVEHDHYRWSDCPSCGRRWHLFYSRGMLPLRRSALRSDVDFQMTEEWFGSGKAARHEILVSRRVVALILKNKWKGADLAPVQTI